MSKNAWNFMIYIQSCLTGTYMGRDRQLVSMSAWCKSTVMNILADFSNPYKIVSCVYSWYFCTCCPKLIELFRDFFLVQSWNHKQVDSLFPFSAWSNLSKYQVWLDLPQCQKMHGDCYRWTSDAPSWSNKISNDRQQKCLV